MASEKILLVDDDRSILRSISKILERKGFRVETAETGSEALKKVRNQHYDMLLLDLRLPDMNGTELLVKAKKEIQHSVKIMITGFPSLESGIKSLGEGVDAYLVKPVPPEELLNVVNEKLCHM